MRNLVLIPFGIAFNWVTSFRNKFFDSGFFKSTEFDIPIIGVGNISVGGNGKTPMVEYLVKELGLIHKVGVLSRGYGRKTRGIHEVAKNHEAAKSGDEPVQVKKKFGDDVVVYVGEKRVEAVTVMLFEHPEIEVIILDDSFQHRAIKPGLNLMLTDQSNIFTRDKILPVGRLREKREGASRADIVIVTKCSDLQNQKRKEEIEEEIGNYFTGKVIFSTQKNSYPIDKSGGKIEKGSRILGFCGIAKPQYLKQYLENEFLLDDFISFADHRNFTSNDIITLINKALSRDINNIVTTEKDFVRLGKNLEKFEGKGINLYYTGVEQYFAEEDDNFMKETINNYVRESYNND